MNKKERFYKLYKSFMDNGANYIGVYIKTPSMKEEELVINPVANVDKKLSYYMSVYDEDMRLISINSIQVVAITAGLYFEDLEDNRIDL